MCRIAEAACFVKKKTKIFLHRVLTFFDLCDTITSGKVRKRVPMMSTLANQIEQYLKQLLAQSASGVLELKRSDLAEIFTCVPSQINYVLDTRFSPSQGYMVESRRGGGGYLRIIRLSMEEEPNLTALLEGAKGRRISRQSGEKLVERLVEEDFLSRREGMLVLALIDDAALKGADDAELLRGNLLNTVLLLLLRDDFT